MWKNRLNQTKVFSSFALALANSSYLLWLPNGYMFSFVKINIKSSANCHIQCADGLFDRRWCYTQLSPGGFLCWRQVSPQEAGSEVNHSLCNVTNQICSTLYSSSKLFQILSATVCVCAVMCFPAQCGYYCQMCVSCMMLDQLCSSERFILCYYPDCCCATQLAQVFKEFFFAIHVEKQETTESPAACLLFSPGSVVWTYDANMRLYFIFNCIFEFKTSQKNSKLRNPIASKFQLWHSL